MKIHVSAPESEIQGVIFAALTAAKAKGTVAPHVYFDGFAPANSRSHTSAMDVHLAAREKLTDEKRASNGSFAGAAQGSFAATYDEWGWFLAELFATNPDAWAGPYKGVDSFNAQTAGKYAPVRTS